MAYDKTNRKLYTTDTQGISTSEIAACLGDYRVTARGRDIGLLCTSPKINKWAKNKPVRWQSFKQLTDSDRTKANYGFDISEIFASSAEELLTKAIVNSCSYTYLQPRGIAYNEPLRMLDFDGYNHKAKRPYDFSFYNQATNANGWVDVYMNASADMKLSDIAPTFAESDLLSHKIVLLYRSVDATSGVNVSFAKKEDGSYVTLSDIENDDAGCILRFSLTEGKHHVVIAATSATEEDMEDRSWFYLPDAYFVAEYNPSEVGFSWYYPEDNSVAAKDSSGRTVYDTTTEIASVYVETAISSEADADGIEGTMTVEIGEYGEYFEAVASQVENYSLPAGGTVNFDKTFTGLSSLMGESYTDKIYVKARLTYRKTSAGAYSTAYFDFKLGALSVSEVAPVSIKEINDSMEW